MSCVVIEVFFLDSSLIEPIRIPQKTVTKQAATNKNATKNNNLNEELLMAPSKTMGI